MFYRDVTQADGLLASQTFMFCRETSNFWTFPGQPKLSKTCADWRSVGSWNLHHFHQG